MIASNSILVDLMVNLEFNSDVDKNKMWFDQNANSSLDRIFRSYILDNSWLDHGCQLERIKLKIFSDGSKKYRDWRKEISHMLRPKSQWKPLSAVHFQKLYEIWSYATNLPLSINHHNPCHSHCNTSFTCFGVTSCQQVNNIINIDTRNIPEPLKWTVARSFSSGNGRKFEKKKLKSDYNDERRDRKITFGLQQVRQTWRRTLTRYWSF